MSETPGRPVGKAAAKALGDEASGGEDLKTPRRARASTQLSMARWNQILEVATDLFREKGFAATSMQDVSDGVGLLKGSLYYYVRSKEELLFEILRDLHEGGAATIEGIRFDSGDPLAELKEYLRQMVLRAGYQRHRLAIFFRDFRVLPLAQQNEIIAERDMYVVAAARLIEEAKVLGVVDPSLNAKVAARSILGASSGTHEWYDPSGPLSIESIAEQIASTIVYGLAGATKASGAANSVRDR